MKKAIIIGASTGIGREVALQLSEQGYEVGITSRRPELLRELQALLPGKSFIKAMDVARPEEARQQLHNLIAEMGGVDMIILNAGVGIPNPTWEDEQTILQTNVNGFVALANFSYEYFRSAGRGFLAGVSSVAGTRGGRMATAYCASKAFVSNYMEGLRCRAKKEGLAISVTDVIPGFVETPMTAKLTYKFWVASAKKAASQMIRAIEQRQPRQYVTRRWALVALLMKMLPIWLYSKI